MSIERPSERTNSKILTLQLETDSSQQHNQDFKGLDAFDHRCFFPFAQDLP